MNRIRLCVIPASAILLGMAAFGALSQAKENAKTVTTRSSQPARPAQKTVQNAEAKKPVPWNIKFESWEHNESTGESEFSKVLAVSDEGTTMHSDVWKLNEKTKTAKATGNLQMTDPQADATGKQADVYYAKGKRLLVLTGDVEILVKPKKDKGEPEPAPGPAPVTVQDGKATLKDPNADDEESSGSARKHPATITCDKLEYEYAKNRKHALLTGNFKVVQKLSDHTRTLTAGKGEWFGLEDRLLLYPPVHVEDTKGLKEFNTDESVTVFVKEGDERVIAKKGSGVYEVKDEPDDEEQPKKTEKPSKKTP